MGYIKVSWSDNQKYSALTDEEFEQYEEDGIIVFCDEGDYLIDEDYIDEIDDICDARNAGYDDCEDEDTSDLVTLNSLLSSDNKEELERGIKIKESIKDFAMSIEHESKKGDIELKNLLELPSRDDNVYGFYVSENWVYLLTCDGRDVDPFDVEPEFLEKFIKEVYAERNNK